MLKPIDIENKEFERQFRGYDKEQVEEFLTSAAEALKEVLRANKELEEANVRYKESLDHYYNLEENMKKALVLAEQAAEEVKKVAEGNADNTIKDAKIKAMAIIQEAEHKAEKIEQDTAELRMQATKTKIRVENLLRAQLDLLNAPENQELYKDVEDVGQGTIKVI